jgi:hypothetical protein
MSLVSYFGIKITEHTPCFINTRNEQLYYIVIDTLNSNATYSKLSLLNENGILVTDHSYDMKLKTFERLYNMK